MELLKNLLVIAFFIALIIGVPLLVIASVNTLFLIAIPYTLETWASTVMLGIFIRGWKSTKENV